MARIPNVKWSTGGIERPNPDHVRVRNVHCMGVKVCVGVVNVAIVLSTVWGLVLASPAGSAAEETRTKIAYRDSGNVFVMKDDGTAKSVVYASGGFPCCFSWSPDGGSFAFEDNGIKRIDISVVGGKFAGSNLMQLAANGQAARPAWSPQGNEIVLVADPYGRESIAVVPPSGGSLQVLYTPPQGSALDFPTWRFDGTRIAFSETDATGMKAIKILDRTTLTISASFVLSVTAIMWLDWARTKDVLAFSDATEQFPGKGQDVFTLDLATGTLTLVVTEARVPSWSPGDLKLVYAKNFSYKRTIIVRDLATGTLKTLAKSGDFPSWSRA